MPRPRSVLGLDIGGANLKAVHSGGAVCLQPFDLWKDPAGLPDALRDALRQLPPFDILAATMTGELCDCFATKREGVCAILDAVTAVAGPIPIRVWQTDGRFVDPSAARVAPLRVAAANWYALAVFCGRYASSGPALLVDVGSTTTDIIPLLDGRPVPRGWTDPERLRSRELVYSGVRRTPLCALLGGAGAAEFFATTQDVYLVLGLLPDDPSDCRTADGRPATQNAAHARLARMLCADTETSTEDERRALAQDLAERQAQLLRQAIDAVCRTLSTPPQCLLLSGSGEFLARRVVNRQPALTGAVTSLADTLGPQLSAAACAHALATLACEQLS